MYKKLAARRIIIKGAGEMASGIAWRLYTAGFRQLILLEQPGPLAVRRAVSFCECLFEKSMTIEGVTAVELPAKDQAEKYLQQGTLAVVIDPEWTMIPFWQPDIVIDAVMAKRNSGTTRQEADLVIGLGPGFTAGQDVHAVIETKRGPKANRVLYTGTAEPNTGIPEQVLGFVGERVLRAPVTGIFEGSIAIGDRVAQGDIAGHVASQPVHARIDGRVRGLLRSGVQITQGWKVGDIEPRLEVNPALLSDKALGIAGAALEAILKKYNR